MAKSEVDIIKQLDDWENASYEVWGDWLEKAKKDYSFYTGKKQWDDDVLAKLDKEKRPHLTLNIIKPKIDMLSGYQRQSRYDYKLIARKGATSSIAQLGRHCIST